MTALPAKTRAAHAALLLSGLALAGLGGLLPSHSSPFAASAALAAGTKAGGDSSLSGPFLSGLGDVPAMPGLAPAESEPLVFDKPTGRIAQALLQGAVERRAVLTFYGQTLPQLGWKRTADGRFEREGEELRLEFVGQPDAAARPSRTLVRFTLSPR